MKKFLRYFTVFLFAFTCLLLVGCGGDDKKDPDSKPDVPPVVEDVYYNISWMDDEGKLIETEKVKEGTVPSHTYTKEETDEFIYRVKGWSLTLNGEVLKELPKASKDATYYAVVEKLAKYNVVFKDYDGKELKTEKVVSGDAAKAPAEPTRKGYTFSKWDVDFQSVEKDLVVTAVYTINKYTITFITNGGSAVDDITKDYQSVVEEPEKPIYEGHKLVCWTTDKEGKNKVEWPITLENDMTLYAVWNETVDIKGLLKSMVDGLNLDPYSFIPDAMTPTYSNNNVLPSEITYDFNNFVNVSDIKYGGFGEQWHMVVDNIRQSETFYNVLTIGEDIINASVAAFNNYLDKNPADTADHSLKETKYTASLKYADGLLYYTLKYATNVKIPLFGEVVPQIDMFYNAETGEKIVRIQLNENNAIKYIIVENSYTFGIEYALAGVHRKAYCSLNRNENNEVTGHIYEFINVKDKDVINSCADFYINDEYASVVGNKASGLIGFKGYINELYNVKTGKLLGYEVRESLTFAKIEKQYNTLWFNLNDISGIKNIKLTEKTEDNKNPHATKNIYINNSTKLFEPKYHNVLGVQTSRHFDIELRDMYYYEFDSAEKKYIEHKVETPMMFIQSGDDYRDFVADMKHVNKVDVEVTLSKTYLDKILDDYDTLIDIFIKNKETVTSDKITEFVGKAIVVE